MGKNKNPRWKANKVVLRGKQTYKMVIDNKEEFEKRFQPEEIIEFHDTLELFEKLTPEQTQVLLVQKSKTEAQNTMAKDVHEAIMDFRKTIKAVTSDRKYWKVFGIGEGVNPGSIPSVLASAAYIINGYNEHRQWAENVAKIIEADIEDFKTMVKELKEADEIQEDAKLTRKEKTMTRDELQCYLENKIRHLSALGVRIYRRKDDRKTKLFEELAS